MSRTLILSACAAWACLFMTEVEPACARQSATEEAPSATPAAAGSARRSDATGVARERFSFAALSAGGMIPLPRGFFIRRPEVRQDLQVTDRQMRQFEEIAKYENAAAQKLIQSVQAQAAQLREASPEQQQKLTTQIQTQSKQLRADIEQRIDAVLTDEQRERLDQIMLQSRGPYAFSDASLLEKLKLNESQRKSIKALFETHQQRGSALMAELREKKVERAEAERRRRDLKQQLVNAIADVLTEEQARNFEQMKGKQLSSQPLPK